MAGHLTCHGQWCPHKRGGVEHRSWEAKRKRVVRRGKGRQRGADGESERAIPERGFSLSPLRHLKKKARGPSSSSSNEEEARGFRPRSRRQERLGPANGGPAQATPDGPAGRRAANGESAVALVRGAAPEPGPRLAAAAVALDARLSGHNPAHRVARRAQELAGAAGPGVAAGGGREGACGLPQGAPALPRPRAPAPRVLPAAVAARAVDRPAGAVAVGVAGLWDSGAAVQRAAFHFDRLGPLAVRGRPPLRRCRRQLSPLGRDGACAGTSPAHLLAAPTASVA
eukprot:scaffold12385_cov102-Isochrysis_galbana.AAC.2